MNTLKQNVSDLPVALILGTGLCALGTVRSLKENINIPIVLVGNEHRGIAQFSRYVAEYFPCDENDRSSIYEVLKKIDDQYERIIPIPTGSDFWVDILIKAPVPFQHFITDIKSEYADLMKKSIQKELALQCSVPYPESRVIQSSGDISSACSELRSPWVVKPLSRTDKAVPFRIRSYYSQEKLAQDVLPHLGEWEFLMSEYIPGPDKYIYTYGSVADKGDVLSEYIGRKLTQRPMRFGVAGIAESTPMIDDVRTFSKAILRVSNFSGISQIEFKWDKRDGQYYLMEINPRIWLWAQTATLSGVNLVLAYYEHLAGLPVTAGKQSRKGMFISGLSIFDNTVREKNLTWVKYYLKSKFVPHIFAIKDHKDKQPYKIERKRFFRKVFHLSK